MPRTTNHHDKTKHAIFLAQINFTGPTAVVSPFLKCIIKPTSIHCPGECFATSEIFQPNFRPRPERELRHLSFGAWSAYMRVGAGRETKLR